MDFYDELRELAFAAGVEPSQTEALCALVAQRLGGTRPYIRRRGLLPEIRPTDTPASIRQRYAVSRSTADRWVNNWRK
jgi:hypothetical protein